MVGSVVHFLPQAVLKALSALCLQQSMAQKQERPWMDRVGANCKISGSTKGIGLGMAGIREH